MEREEIEVQIAHLRLKAEKHRQDIGHITRQMAAKPPPDEKKQSSLNAALKSKMGALNHIVRKIEGLESLL